MKYVLITKLFSKFFTDNNQFTKLHKEKGETGKLAAVYREYEQGICVFGYYSLVFLCLSAPSHKKGFKMKT